jgi:anaerobic ribonucleoside-triphosphate reductase
MSAQKKKKTPQFKVKKRDGRLVKFDRERIESGIFKAAEGVGGTERKRAKEVTDEVIARLIGKYSGKKYIKTEQIADIVKQTLLDMGHGKTSMAFSLFVDLRNQVKNIKSLIDADTLVRDYIDKLDWQVNENSNMAYSWQGLNNYISSTIQANYWLHSIYPKEISDANISKDFHIHDLGMLASYCCGWSLEDLLLKGFAGVKGKISSKPPRHFGAALGQCVNFFYTLQHEAAGAQAFSNFDTYLAPFIRYDKLSYKEVKQKMQEFLFNMNVPTRVGCQTPFTNITMDLIPSGQLAEQNVIIGGVLQKEKYKDFQKEMDMINKAFCEVMMEGDANGRLFSYPIPTYNLTKDFDWDKKEYIPVWKMTAKYGVPYFSNFINSDMSPDDARSMCCRLRLDNRVLRKRGGGLFGANPLTGSVGVVTINLPRIGIEAKNKREFYKILNKKMDLAKKSLIIKRKFIEKYMDAGLYPYSRFYLADIKKRFGEYYKNHFNTIGILGMNECLINFFGDKSKDITSKEGRKFGLEILDHMRERLLKYQNETNQLFNLEATPGEGATYKFAKADKKKSGEDIITAADVGRTKTDVPYYTNSSQLPVGLTDDIFETLDLQDEFQCKYTGGTVLHIYLGERISSVEATKNLIRKIATNYKLPYFSITPTFSVCPKHGYISGEHKYCPVCDSERGYKEGMPFDEE